MLPSFTIPLHKSNIHWVPISPVACIISVTSPDNPGTLLLFFITPYTAAHKYKKAKIHLKYEIWRNMKLTLPLKCCQLFMNVWVNWSMARFLGDSWATCSVFHSNPFNRRLSSSFLPREWLHQLWRCRFFLVHQFSYVLSFAFLCLFRTTLC